MRTRPALYRSFVITATLLCVALPVRAAGPLQYHAVSPCRLIDTRDGSGASNETAGARSNPGPHTFRVQGFCGIPLGAQAASLNITVITPTQAGDLRVFPSNVANPPVVAVMSYNAAEPALCNGAIVPLAPVSVPSDNDIKVLIGMACGASCGTVQLTMDVTGYFDCINPGSC